LLNLTYDGTSQTYQLARKFIYSPGIDEPICIINVDNDSETWYWYVFDGLGSVIALLNTSGSKVKPGVERCEIRLWRT
jgi:hypothetical protein